MKPRSCTRLRDDSLNSRCRNGCLSSTNCRATPWARCRRTFCARRIRISTRNNLDEGYHSMTGKNRWTATPPTISGELSRDEVQLPPDVTEKDIDDILFSLLRSHWKKVALVVANAIDCRNLMCLSISPEIFAARLRALSDSGRIEGIGDLRMWRHSEVRLKD